MSNGRTSGDNPTRTHPQFGNVRIIDEKPGAARGEFHRQRHILRNRLSGLIDTV